MSHASIAAALALDEVSAGERLTAFALASYANREHRAWPGTRLAAARAGLSRSQFLAARDGLERRGLIVVEAPGGGRGQCPVVFLSFAAAGARLDREINPLLFERTLGFSRAKGSARLLLATLAALADSEMRVADVSTEELCQAAGMADSTYRRARAALLAGGEVQLEVVGGGRAKTNVWVLSDPAAEAEGPLRAARPRPVPVPRARPLVGAVKGPVSTGVSDENPAQGRTVSAAKGPGSGGVTESNPAQFRMVFAQTPPLTPPETPSPYARAGGEPQNQRTVPPNPPEGGRPVESVTVAENYVSERGRRRQRHVVVQLDAVREQFRQPTEADRRDWRSAQAEVTRIIGASTFEIWFGHVQLAAVDPGRCLVLVAPDSTRAWLRSRFATVLDRAGACVGRALRLGDDRESQLLSALALSRPASPKPVPAPVLSQPIPHQLKEAI